MNKIIQALKKALNVRKLSLLLISTLFCSCNLIRNNRDIEVINALVGKLKSDEEQAVLYLNPKNDNRYIVDVFESEMNDSVSFKKDINRGWLTKGMEKNKKDTVLPHIFNDVNYKHIITQIHQGRWKENYIYKNFPEIELMPDKSRKPTLYIARPMFTKNGYALLYYQYNTTLAMSVLSNEGGKWREVRFIPLGLVSLKAHQVE